MSGFSGIAAAGVAEASVCAAGVDAVDDGAGAVGVAVGVDGVADLVCEVSCAYRDDSENTQMTVTVREVIRFTIMLGNK